jgi:hypothetical protein
MALSDSLYALLDSTALDMTAGFADVTAQINARTAKGVTDLIELFLQGMGPQQRLAAHRQLAEDAQASILRSYDQLVTAQRRPANRTAYRTTANRPQNVRLAGGVLRRALADRGMIAYDADGFAFINTGLLDQEAAHWARLNSGAGARGAGGSRRMFQVRFSNLVIATIGLNMAPSPSFMLPAGYWWNGEGMVAPGGNIGADQFYPIGEGPRAGVRPRVRRADDDGGRRPRAAPFQRRRVSQGIRARNFLDAGFARVANDLGPTYKRMMDDAFTSAGRRARTRFTTGVQEFRVPL